MKYEENQQFYHYLVTVHCKGKKITEKYYHTREDILKEYPELTKSNIYQLVCKAKKMTDFKEGLNIKKVVVDKETMKEVSKEKYAVIRKEFVKQRISELCKAWREKKNKLYTCPCCKKDIERNSDVMMSHLRECVK